LSKNILFLVKSVKDIIGDYSVLLLRSTCLVESLERLAWAGWNVSFINRSSTQAKYFIT